MITRQYKNERKQMAKTIRVLVSRGLIEGSNGNISIRLRDDESESLYMITPSGVPYETLMDENLVVVNQDLEPTDHNLIPSTESLLHREIYNSRSDVHAIVHTHSLFASVVAVSSESIPAILDEMVVCIGGQIDVAAYAFPGTEELAIAGVKALGEKKAFLLRNHGACAVGENLEEAVMIAILVERFAQIFIHAEMIGGARCIPDTSIELEREIYTMKKNSKSEHRKRNQIES